MSELEKSRFDSNRWQVLGFALAEWAERRGRPTVRLREDARVILAKLIEEMPADMRRLFRDEFNLI